MFLSEIVFSKVLFSAGVRAAGRGAKVSFSGPERIKNTTTLLRFSGTESFLPVFSPADSAIPTPNLSASHFKIKSVGTYGYFCGKRRIITK